MTGTQGVGSDRREVMASIEVGEVRFWTERYVVEVVGSEDQCEGLERRTGSGG